MEYKNVAYEMIEYLEKESNECSYMECAYPCDKKYYEVKRKNIRKLINEMLHTMDKERL